MDTGNIIAIVIGILAQAGMLMSFRVSLEHRLTRLETKLGVSNHDS